MAMLRLTSSAVVSNALRAISAPRILSAPIITNAFIDSHQVSLAPMGGFPVLFHHHQFSTGARKPIDERLVKILKSEIKLQQLSLGETIPAVPTDFPFTIEYSSCGQLVTLKRELNGEKIVALVTSPVPEDDESDDDDDDDSSSDESSSSDSSSENSSDESNSPDQEKEMESDSKGEEPHVHMTVTISKENGKKLELAVSAAAHRLIVAGISVMEPSHQKLMSYGPYFVDIESDLQYAMREYLEVRGFDKSIGGFLHEYMVHKAKEDPVGLLKKVKKFVRD